MIVLPLVAMNSVEGRMRCLEAPDSRMLAVSITFSQFASFLICVMRSDATACSV